MCLSIVLRKMKGFAGVTIVALLTLSICHVSAVENPQVTITTGASSYSESYFFVDVTVSFGDKALYNEQVYLSYHIVDGNGEMLVYENQRLPLSVDENGNAGMTVSIDSASVPVAAEKVWIQFDLVDEKNVYWFSGNPAINFQDARIEYDSSLLLPPPIETNEDEASSVPVVSVVLNCMMWTALLILLFRYLRRAKNSSSREK